MPEFQRAHHRTVLTALQCLDGDFLNEAKCFFGGGTQLAMTFGEYRVSRDMDFLCSSRKGFRLLREQVSQNSLGGITRQFFRSGFQPRPPPNRGKTPLLRHFSP
ncbi:MAG: nucleotidyl transferase AbiEii/AbiGii toxin family protein [Woeseiaceae bacterium]|nr:nucleotidyl transferase AbiEii/AbiGii toxin family protein [Woeseiaceae bacterium]